MTRLQRVAPLAAAAALALLVAAPLGFGFPTGITKDNAGLASFAVVGCAACHGEHEKFAAVDNSKITWTIVDATGKFLNGPYDPHAKYTITITLNETNAPSPPKAADGTAHHAGFNLAASGGKFEALPVGDEVGASQVSKDQTQATHVEPTHTAWHVQWTPPESGAVAFQLYVNDVNGVNGADAGDQPHQVGFWITDAKGAQVGAAKEEHVEYGISLQQYWIGLIGLAGMLFVMVAGFVYLKFANPHNTDQGDR